jgi:photosystem II stability/assembly factor-like uncharacterized protein
MQPFRLFAATGSAVARIDCDGNDRCDTTLMLDGSGAQCIAVDPHDADRAYVGTFDSGVYRTRDAGETWEQVGGNIPHQRVLSIAMSPSRRTGGLSAVYVGTEPSSLYRSDDDGQTWQDFPTLTELPSAPTWSFPPRPWTSHVRWIAPHQNDPDMLYLGIELGGVMRSADGGQTWEDRKPGSYHDSHSVRTHPIALDRVYEAAGGGVAWSLDRGATWSELDDGMDRHYVWALAIDPADPDLWYVSATHSARYAHRSNGEADAHIYRKRGEAPWQPLAVGTEDPLPYMPYALLTLRSQPDVIIAGMQNGQIMLSEDAGDSWRALDVQLTELLALAEA